MEEGLRSSYICFIWSLRLMHMLIISEGRMFLIEMDHAPSGDDVNNYDALVNAYRTSYLYQKKNLTQLQWHNSSLVGVTHRIKL